MTAPKSPQNGSPAPETPSPAGRIDVVQLAERVYRLMLSELRLARARQGEPGRRRR